MNLPRLIARQIGALLRREKLNAEMTEEMQHHLEAQTRRNLAAGMSPNDAQYAARRSFGDVEQIKERARDERGFFGVETFLRDLRFAARSLRRTPGFTVTAITTLTLGLALVASTVAVVNAYLLRAMPFPESHRLYHVIYAPVGQPEPRGITALDWGALSDVVEVADSSIPARFFLREGGPMQMLGGLRVSRGSLEALGVRAVVGRAFAEGDFATGGEPVAMIGHALWREHFGGDPAIVGRRLRVSATHLTADQGQSYRITGVLPPQFHFAREYARGAVEMVVPLQVPMRAYFVRLRAEVPAADAEQRITETVRQVATSEPPGWRGVRLESVRARYVAGLRAVLVAMAIAVGLVLLIVGVNVAILTLLRALRRQKELAVRVALGAGRRHIARMLLAETLIVCGLALTAALALTAGTLRAVGPLVEERLGRPVPGGVATLAVDSTVLIAVGGATLVIALSLSFLPMLTLWHRGLADALRRTGSGATDLPSMRRLRSGLITAEIAASFALLFGGALTLRSLVNLLHTDLGFSTERVWRARVALPDQTYPDAASFLRFHDRLRDWLTAEPDTEFAMTNHIPFYPNPRQPVETDSGEIPGFPIGVLAVSDGYFSTLRIGLKEGRSFVTADRPGSEPVAMVSETLARRLWPQGQALGHRLRTAVDPLPNSPLAEWRTVVGVVRDTRQTHTDIDLNDIFVPFAQAPSRYAPLFLRSDRPASYWSEALRAAAAEIDPDVQISELHLLSAEGERLLAQPRFLTTVLTGFAGFSALLALLGIYGVTAYGVQQRERELAIRIALGASGAAVVRTIVERGAVVLAAGLALGLLGAVSSARVLASQIHGVSPLDAVTLLATGALVATAGVIATWWPARRAAKIDPMTILKSE